MPIYQLVFRSDKVKFIGEMGEIRIDFTQEVEEELRRFNRGLSFYNELSERALVITCEDDELSKVYTYFKQRESEAMTKLIDFSLTFASDSVTLESPAMRNPLVINKHAYRVREMIATILTSFKVSHAASGGYRFERSDEDRERKISARCTEECLTALQDLFKGVAKVMEDVEKALEKDTTPLTTILLAFTPQTVTLGAVGINESPITVAADEMFLHTLKTAILQVEANSKEYTIRRSNDVLTQEYELSIVLAGLIKIMFEVRTKV